MYRKPTPWTSPCTITRLRITRPAYGAALAEPVASAVPFPHDDGAGAGSEGARPAGERHDLVQRTRCGPRGRRRTALGRRIRAPCERRRDRGARGIRPRAARDRRDPSGRTAGLGRRLYAGVRGASRRAGTPPAPRAPPGWLALQLIELGDFTNSVAVGGARDADRERDGRAGRAGRVRAVGAGRRAARQWESRRGGAASSRRCSRSPSATATANSPSFTMIGLGKSLIEVGAIAEGFACFDRAWPRSRPARSHRCRRASSPAP